MVFLGGKIGEEVVWCWPQWTLFYFWGFLHLFESIKKCDHESAHNWIHRYTNRSKPVL